MDSIHSRKPPNVGSQDRSAFSLFIPGLILFILNTLWDKLWAFYQQGFEASATYVADQLLSHGKRNRMD
ncbi:hypothetical protein C8R32_103240 [Nitrosospira sp. Nsp5]|uniref:Uncharacterized protein n=1 Tax=Nitrosospira multiformis TaxID=1231 RepID=A0ABY0TAM8_9PROT|nr:hypothetical protein C8R32_103240 [Nitrosospira sp. Nsp5]SDQ25995.1 hypothetical protein SAMN05216402_0059 [Nitrosospira multiformis]